MTVIQLLDMACLKKIIVLPSMLMRLTQNTIMPNQITLSQLTQNQRKQIISTTVG